MIKGIVLITPTALFRFPAIPLLVLVASGCAELGQLRTETEQQEKEIAHLKQERDEFKKAYYDVVEIREKENREAAAAREQLQREKEDVEAELTQQKEQAEADKQKYQADLQQQRAERAAAEKQLGAAVDLLKTDLAKARENAKALEANASTLKERAVNAEQSVDQITTERDRAKTDLAAIQQRATAAENDLAAAQKQLAEAQAALEKEKKLRQEQERAASQKAIEIERLKQELVRLRTDALKAPVNPNESATSGAVQEKQPGQAVTLSAEQAAALVAALKKALDAASIPKTEYEVSRDRSGLVVRLSSDWLFQEQSVLVSDVGAKGLGAVTEALRQNPDLRIRVEGHTDSLPVRNLPFPDNWGLASARADSVARWLETNGHVAGKRLLAVGRSRYDPLADNSTPEGRKKNRRVELWILPPAE